ncbi:MAG TPA: DUF362 domain-containing protein [Bacteroidota bacterium]|nr:DUF362 domain-containing protein [Bacteroidota bacterium]
MDRRSFLLRTGGAALLVGSQSSKANLNWVANAFSEAKPAGNFDLVAIKGGEPEVMFRKGMEAMGGMRSFVKKGQKVALKPNIGWDVSPERGGNTNPKLVSEIIRQCLDAGAREVVVFDHTCDDWQRTYKNSGIAAAVADAGGKMAPGNSEGYFQEVTIAGAKNLTKAKVHEVILGSDVFINVPVLKNHNSALLTMSMKNLMGVVWDRGNWHANDLHQCIADFPFYRKPDLNILDAYYVMTQNGPRGISAADVVTMKSQLISTDMVAIDTAGAKLFGLDPKSVRYIQIASAQKIGRSDLEHLNIKRIAL